MSSSIPDMAFEQNLNECTAYACGDGFRSTEIWEQKAGTQVKIDVQFGKVVLMLGIKYIERSTGK